MRELTPEEIRANIQYNESKMHDRPICHYCDNDAYSRNAKGFLTCKTHAGKGTPYIAMVKPNRNDKCNCGSGKKYKRCCLLTT